MIFQQFSFSHDRKLILVWYMEKIMLMSLDIKGDRKWRRNGEALPFLKIILVVFFQ